MDDVGNHATLVDGEALGDAVALVVDRQELPHELAGVGYDTGSDGEGFDGLVDDTCGKEVELETACGVAGIGASVDLEDDLHRIFHAGLFTKLFDDFGDEASFAFVSHADAAIGDEFAFVICEGHVCVCFGGYDQSREKMHSFAEEIEQNLQLSFKAMASPRPGQPNRRYR